MNPKEFTGKRAYWVFYDMLMTREEISLEGVGEKYLGRKKKINETGNDNELNEVRETVLKQAASKVIRRLNQLEPGSVELLGNNRTRTYRYIGTLIDPLRDERNQDSQHGIANYTNFCKHIAGIIPRTWIEYYFSGKNNLPILLQENTVAQQKIGTGLISSALVPILLDSISNKLVLCFSYTDSRNQYFPEVVFHPQYLKEWDGRWYVCGETDSFSQEKWYKGDPHVTLEVDRIGYMEFCDMPYKESPETYWVEYFKPIVGCRRDKQCHVSHVRIRTSSYATYRLLVEYPIHASQQSQGYFINKKWYGEFEYDLVLNNEFIGKVLELGSTLKIVGDKEAVKLMKSTIKKMYTRYFGNKYHRQDE